MATSDSMNVFQHTAGARTRNVVNVHDPGSSGTKSYTFTGNFDAPSSPTDGFANYRRQRYLHLQLKSEGFDHSNNKAIVYLYLYNSMSQTWSLLQVPAAVDDDGDNRYFDWKVEFSGNGSNFERYYIIDINGAERVALELGDYDSDDGSATVKVSAWMGVNSF
jgi:hypothetical protein